MWYPKIVMMTMILRKLLFVVSLLFAAQNLLAQAPSVIRFTETDVDLGSIQEEDGPVEYTFRFINITDEPVFLTRVKASCGCTTPDYSREGVQPGDTGIVTARFDPTNRPGGFRKSLTINTRPAGAPLFVYINGYVKRKPGDPASDFPFRFGDLRIAQRTVNFGLITNQQVASREFEVYNEGSDTLRFEDTVLAPVYLQVKAPAIPPRSRANLLVSYDPVLVNDLGYQSANFVLYTADSARTAATIYVMATIEEYFPPMSDEEKAKTPRLQTDKTLVERSSIKMGDVVEVAFTLRNTGKSPLNIRQLKSNCTCLKYKLEKYDLAPGEQSQLTLIFNSAGRPGTQQKSISIFSNDPSEPTQMVSIKMSVER